MRGALLAGLCALALAGCGGAAASDDRPAAPAPPVTERWADFSWPTATYWPTFTPSPTATPTPMPTATPTPFPTDTPRPPRVLTPTPTVVVMAEPTPTPGFEADPRFVPAAETPAVTPTPAPTPYGRLWSAPAHLEMQTLLPVRSVEALMELSAKSYDKLPSGERRFGSNTRYLLWVVKFDVTDAPEAFRMTGLVRWLNVTGRLAEQPLVVHQEAQTISKTEPGWWRALGEDLPGLWRPGSYRVEFWDDRDQPVVGWDFEIY